MKYWNPPPRSIWIEHVIHTGIIESLPCTGHLLKEHLLTYLYKGQLPGALELPLESAPGFHDAYIRTYIERDVRLLANIPDLALFTRFFQSLHCEGDCATCGKFSSVCQSQPAVPYRFKCKHFLLIGRDDPGFQSFNTGTLGNDDLFVSAHDRLFINVPSEHLHE